MVIELDGPPRTYFEVFDGPPSNPETKMVRFIYVTVIADRQEEIDAFLFAMKTELDRIAPNDGIIWWRVRPTDHPPLAKRGSPRRYMRLQTSPPLPHSWWLAHSHQIVGELEHSIPRWQANKLP